MMIMSCHDVTTHVRYWRRGTLRRADLPHRQRLCQVEMVRRACRHLSIKKSRRHFGARMIWPFLPIPRLSWQPPGSSREEKQDAATAASTDGEVVSSFFSSPKLALSVSASTAAGNPFQRTDSKEIWHHSSSLGEEAESAARRQSGGVGQPSPLCACGDETSATSRSRSPSPVRPPTLSPPCCNDQFAVDGLTPNCVYEHTFSTETPLVVGNGSLPPQTNTAAPSSIERSASTQANSSSRCESFSCLRKRSSSPSTQPLLSFSSSRKHVPSPSRNATKASVSFLREQVVVVCERCLSANRRDLTRQKTYS